ncbi:MAG: toll/interleukin-1 receptor domain-containing protein, partial [Hyphomonadaceae bacterium]|nr:toll/interleukin-1 receptor domain-containing protein [Hyphomonadaceae bacterium]
MRVFISSTRIDADWTDQLCAFLGDHGFKPTLDGRDIGSADVWKHRVQALIASAEAVVFVLTDDSAQAIECDWEISEAQRQGKRVIPVLPAALQGR